MKTPDFLRLLARFPLLSETSDSAKSTRIPPKWQRKWQRDFGERCTNLDSCRALVILLRQTAQEVPPIHLNGCRVGNQRPQMWSLRGDQLRGLGVVGVVDT